MCIYFVGQNWQEVSATIAKNRIERPEGGSCRLPAPAYFAAESVRTFFAEAELPGFGRNRSIGSNSADAMWITCQ